MLFYNIYLERKNTPLKMTTSYVLGKLWSGSSRILWLIDQANAEVDGGLFSSSSS